MSGTEKTVAAGSIQETARLLIENLGDELNGLSVDKVVGGIFFTGVTLSSGHAGMAFTPIGEMPQAVCCPRTASFMPQAGKLRGQNVKEFIHWAYDANVLKAAMGISVLNALSHYLWDKRGTEGCRIISGVDAVEGTTFSPDDRVVLIGALVPYIRMLKEKKCVFSILEQSPKALKGDELDYYVPPEGAEETLSNAQAVIATGATMVNGSLDQLLDWTPDESKVIVVGPTASMLPYAFFDRGVDVLGGVRITDPEAAMLTLSEGGSGYHMFGKCAEKIIIQV
jgi:uncharacterized protein (DUF4213/DUF364 family)